MEISGEENPLAGTLRNESVREASIQRMEAVLRGSERHILILKEEQYNLEKWAAMRLGSQ